LAVGTHDLTASYAANAAFAASTSMTVPETVNAAPTAIAIGVSANPATTGQSVAITATVTALAPVTATPTGTVTFIDSGTPLATVGLDATGRATLSTRFATTGSHLITVVFNGSLNFAAIQDSFFELVNTATAAAPSVTTLSASATAVAVGRQVTFTATVKTAAGAGTPTGSVTFLDGSLVLGTAPIDARGRATFTTSFTTAGSHTVRAVYGGDDAFAASAASLLEDVTRPRKWWRS
jgi:hypothetical protein